jgi:hypothetical protein
MPNDAPLTCPNGHSLPNFTPKGQCTPVHCAAETKTVRGKQKRALETKPPPERALAPALGETEANQTAVLARNEFLLKSAHAVGRDLARRKLLGFPEGPLQGAEAEEWADKKIVEMLPLAVAELEFQLKYGDDEMRAKAANKILDATGRGKRENGAGAVAPIIMIQSGNAFQLPWVKDAKTVDAIVVPNQLPPKSPQ